MDESEILRKEISKNAISLKNKMIKNWVMEDSAPALQIAGMKLLSTDKEHSRISGQHIDNTTKGDKIESIKLIFSEEDDSETTVD